MKKRKRRHRAERRKPKRPPLKYEQIDPRCRADILRAARGEDSAWPADNHPTKHDGQRLGYQERFERGDKQMMLWAIVLDAEDSKPSPPWAIEALKRAMIEMAVGASWADVLGRETAERGNKEGANVDSIQRRAEYQYRVWDFFPDPVPWGQKGKLLDAAEEKFGIGRSLITRYHTRMRQFRRRFKVHAKVHRLYELSEAYEREASNIRRPARAWMAIQQVAHLAADPRR